MEKIVVQELKAYMQFVKERNSSEFISDQVSHDLDLDKVFLKLNLTNSTVGSQYLYECFHKLKDKEEDRFEFVNCQISDELKNDIEGLYKVAGLRIYQFFDPSNNDLKRWMNYTMAMPYILGALLLLSFISKWFLFILFSVLIFNSILHLWHKRDSIATNSVLTELQKMVLTGRKIYEEFGLENKKLDNSIRSLEKLRRHTWFFFFVESLQNDLLIIFGFPLELISSLLLYQFRKKIRIKKILKSKSTEIEDVFRLVGRTDFALNYQAHYSSDRNICRPKIIKELRVEANKLVHPALENPVDNSFSLVNRSMLITGSNMSGKSTFIRSIALNTILGKGMGLSFCSSSIIPEGNVLTCFRVSDDLLQSKSYYQREVETIKEIVSTAKKGDQVFLDEIFKGTNKKERMAISIATLRFLAQQGATVFVSTHDVELNRELKNYYDTYYFQDGINNDGKIEFDYRLKKGTLKKSNAIAILELNDFPKELIDMAKELVGNQND